MKELTLKQAYKLYNELWEWLIKYPDKNKLDWPKWPKKDYIEADSFCFACEYVRLQNITKFNICFKKFFLGSCFYCPLTGLWGNACMNYESPYRQWGQAKNTKINWYKKHTTTPSK